MSDGPANWKEPTGHGTSLFDKPPRNAMTPTETGYCKGGTVECTRLAKWIVGGMPVCDVHAKAELFKLAKEGKLKI